MKILKYLTFTFLLCPIALSIPEFIHKNSGESTSTGSVRGGGLENGYLLPFCGNNFRYFSFSSYYLANNAYVHHLVYQTVLDAYKTCEKTAPGIVFGLMESSDKNGGDMLIHRTHENGLSVDFMIPRKRKGRQFKWLDYLGWFHYLLEFDNQGKFKANKQIEIDFEAMAKHILAIDKAAQANGLSIRKVILKIELQDDLFNTPTGKLLQERDIYFVKRLFHMANVVHDDHYHIDFKIKEQ